MYIIKSRTVNGSEAPIAVSTAGDKIQALEEVGDFFANNDEVGNVQLGLIVIYRDGRQQFITAQAIPSASELNATINKLAKECLE